jgi:hypothetical protein
MVDEFSDIIVDRLTIRGVCKLEPAIGTSGKPDRLSIKALAGAMELQVLPNPEFNEPSRIVSQIQLFGRNRETNGVQWAKRASTTIFNDSAGGEAVYIDSTLSSDAPKDEVAMPMVFRMQHDTHGQPDIDVVFHPSDYSLELKDYSTGKFIRKTIQEWMDGTPKKIDEL